MKTAGKSALFFLSVIFYGMASLAAGDLCAIKTNDGRLVKEGNCEDTKKNFILRDLDEKLLRRRDIDECAEGWHDCDPHAKCINTAGSFTCVCHSGYTGTGKTCEDVDECTTGLDDPCGTANTHCVNEPGNYSCRCSSGYEGDPFKPGVCTDVDECTAGLDHRCKTINAECVNGPGNYTCRCLSGYEGDPVKPGVCTGHCQFITGNVCYWIYYNNTESVNFTQAEEICAKNGSVAGYFPTRQVYNETLQQLRSVSGGSGHIWTGIKINPMTADVTYPYTEVYINLKHVSVGMLASFTSIYLYASSWGDWMSSESPDYKFDGVLCQYTLN